MAKIKIPVQVQEESKKIISDFNQKEFNGDSDVAYMPEFKGDYLYLNRKEYEKINPVVRLKYTGNMKKWEFEIFKWSSETYDSEDLFFSGCEYINGTIVGAMKARKESYPCITKKIFTISFMTFKDFKKNIDLQMLERGFGYYQNGSVISVEEVDTGLWEAEVEGTENYYVTIRTDKYKIKDWDCDCPYDMGPVCKHVVAVFYTIAEEMEIEKEEQPNEKTSSKKDNKKRIENIFKTASKEELQNFIVDQFSKERSLKNSFIVYFADMLNENPEEKYKIIVSNLFFSARDRNGFIDYRKAQKLADSLIHLAEKGEKILLKGNINESLTICKTLIENVSEFVIELDDSDGELSSAIDNAFETLSKIVSKAPPMLKDELFGYCINEYQKEKYQDFGFEERFLDLLPMLITTEEQEMDFFELIRRQIEIEKTKEYSNYNIVRLICAKIEYLKEKNLHIEAKNLIGENIIYPEFREIVINETIKKKDFEKAKKLCLEGIVISEKENHDGTTDKWRQKLLHISELEKNIPDIRKWSELIFFKSRFDMKYYKKLKSTYANKDDWTDASEMIIEKIRKKDKFANSWYADTLANIFIEEKYLERLLTLVQSNSKHINFIDCYARYLKDQYPKEIIALYVEAIKSHAKITDRKIYEEVAIYLKKLSKIKESESTLMQLLNYFRGLYRNRRAMMEILNENFPEKKN